MPAKQLTLSKKKDFARIFKQGRSYYTKLLGVKVDSGQSGVNRFGIIISAKVSKKAVERNRLKRQLRAALKELNGRLAVGLDLALVALPGLIKQDYKTIAGELEKIFLKLRLLK